MVGETSADFERDLTLADLLRGIDKQRLQTALEGVANTPMTLVDIDGNRLFGAPQIDATPKVPVVGELETIGYLFADLPETGLKSAADLLVLLLRCNARYLLASDLHVQTQRADFEELQTRHAALQQSEQRYKALSEHLEERVQQQVKSLEQARIKLFANEKLASVGRLAAGVAHEINNPIGFIRSNLGTASEYLNSFGKLAELVNNGADWQSVKAAWQQEDLAFILEDLHDILQESISGAERISAIVKDLRGFSRIDEIEHVEADINQIISQMCHVAAAELRDKAEVVLDLGEIPPLACRPAELGQVLLSLLMNAVDAVMPVGKVHIRTYMEEQHIYIEIRDNGCGIAESDLPYIYDPFFTRKDVGKGMGLGLTVCRNVIQSHQGEISVKSKPGVGTRVSICLPVATNQV
ncbi:MAG: sensor histidine kinase [Gammaproteobacteria bacterium]